MGGPHVSELPDEALGREGGPRHADAVALGMLNLQRLHVCDHVLDLISLEHILEWRHQRIAILDPRFQRLIANFDVICGECSALENSLQTGPDFFYVSIGVMAHRAFIFE